MALDARAESLVDMTGEQSLRGLISQQVPFGMKKPLLPLLKSRSLAALAGTPVLNLASHDMSQHNNCHSFLIRGGPAPSPGQRQEAVIHGVEESPLHTHPGHPGSTGQLLPWQTAPPTRWEEELPPAMIPHNKRNS